MPPKKKTKTSETPKATASHLDPDQQDHNPNQQDSELNHGLPTENIEDTTESTTVVTPTKETNKTTQKKKKHIVVFFLKSGLTAMRHSKKGSEQYYENNKELIRDQRLFVTEEEYQEYLTSKKSTTEVTQPMLDNTQNKRTVDEILAIARKNAPENRIIALYHTKIETPTVLFILKHVDENGRPFWLHKHFHFIPIMQAVTEQHPTLFPKVNQAIRSLNIARERDLAGGPDTALVDKKGFNRYVIYGYFEIDLKEVTSLDLEEKYITNTLNKLLDVLKESQTMPDYLAALQKFVMDKNPKMWSLMESPRTGRNFKSYIKSCRLEVTKITRLNDHVTDTEADRLVNGMMINQLNGKDKYEEDTDDEQERGENT